MYVFVLIIFDMFVQYDCKDVNYDLFNIWSIIENEKQYLYFIDSQIKWISFRCSLYFFLDQFILR